LSHRIAVVIDAWDHPFNGTVVSTRRFVRELQALGMDVRLLTLDDGSGDVGRGFSKLSIPGLNHIIDRMHAPLAVPDRKQIRAALEGCTLLHVQWPFFLGHTAIGIARELNIPVVCSFHVQPENILQNLGLDSTLLSKALYKLFIARLYGRADHVIAPSNLAARMLKHHDLTRPISVLSNGVPERFFGIQRSTERHSDLVVLSVGRLAREKHQDLILEAAARSRHRDRLTVHLVGVGPCAPELQALAARLNVRAHIGRADDDELNQLYARADLFVHASGVELEGMSVLEAMASGNTVVVSDSEDSEASQFVDYEHGRFTAGDVTSLVDNMDFWLDDAEARSERGCSNRRAARAHHLDRSTGLLIGIYESLLGDLGLQQPASGVGR